VILPLPLLLGLLVAALDRELLPTLPGATSLPQLLALLPSLAVPTLLAAFALRLARAELLTGRRYAVPPRSLLRLSSVATPLVVHALFAFGGLGDWIDAAAWNSHLGRTVLTSLPAFVAEVPRLGLAALAGATCDVLDGSPRSPVPQWFLPAWSDIAGFARLRLGGPLLVAMPLGLYGAAFDLLQLHRPTYVAVQISSGGSLVGMLGLLLLLLLVLPFWFRIAFATRELPEPPGNRLRATARALGFAPERLYELPTGMRALNAMLVGPLPPGRSLCLTDGLLRELEPEALAGVVAHEVGHARKGHPALLLAAVVLVPLLLLAPLRLFDLGDAGFGWQVALAIAAVLAFLGVVRALAHRFEHEADVASVAALGAGPCSHALLVVSRLAQPVTRGWFGRLFTLHPEEPARWELMRRYETEPWFRAAFDAKSRRLRAGIGVSLAVAISLAGLACSWEWPWERPFVLLHAGDHRAALAAVDGRPAPPARWQQAWQRLQAELAVVRSWRPPAADWREAQTNFGDEAWQRGEQELAAAGPAAARPWFALVLAHAERPTDLQRALYEFCDAAVAGDTARMDALRGVVRRLGVPRGLAMVFAD
jgi:Zn-dependent protease with chaperone function